MIAVLASVTLTIPARDIRAYDQVELPSGAPMFKIGKIQSGGAGRTIITFLAEDGEVECRYDFHDHEPVTVIRRAPVKAYPLLSTNVQGAADDHIEETGHPVNVGPRAFA
jgi:hypothetical protein